MTLYKTVVVQKDQVSVNGNSVNDFTFSEGVQSWEADNKTSSAAKVNLDMYSRNAEGTPLPPSSLVNSTSEGMHPHPSFGRLLSTG